MKYWSDDKKRQEWINDLWTKYKATQDPDYLADMLAVGVFKEGGIPDEIAKEMFEWLEALNKHGIKEKNTFTALTEERNEFIFSHYFFAKEIAKIEDGEARRLVQKVLKDSENHFMELDAIRQTIRRHYHTWRQKNAAWCEETLEEFKLFEKAIEPVEDPQKGFVSTGQATQDFLASFAKRQIALAPEGTGAHADLKKAADFMLDANEKLFKKINQGEA